MSYYFDKELKPIKKGLAFMVSLTGKPMPLVAKLCFLPVHGLNYAFSKMRNKITGRNIPYNGAKITAASNTFGKMLASIPNNIAENIKRM